MKGHKLAHTSSLHILKVFKTFVLSATLFLSPLQIQTLYAQNGFEMATGMIQHLTGQISQHQQQMNMIRQQTAMMQSLRPQTTPARFFPGCQLPAVAQFPENVCRPPAQDPGEFQMAQTIHQAAMIHANSLEGMLNTAKNQRPQNGIQCLQDGKTATNSQMQQRLRSLQQMIDLIEKNNQQFRDDNAEILGRIQDDHALLTGAQGARGLASRTENFAERFSPECRNILDGPGQISSTIQRQGLTGLQAGIADDQQEAQNFAANRNSLIHDINQASQHIANTLREHGVEPRAGESGQEALERALTNHPAARQLLTPLADVVVNDISELNDFKTRVQSDLRQMGIDYQIPRMDGNFQVDFAHFEAGANNYFRKQFVNECVTGSSSTGLGMSARDIMRSLRHTQLSRGEDRVVLDNYREALQNILESDAFIEDKLEEIRRLDQTVGDGFVRVTYRDGDARERTVTPYDLYMQTIQACQQQFEQDDTFSTTGSHRSMAMNVQRARERMRELQNRHQNFLSNLSSNISDRLINCQGRSLQAGQCSTDLFNPGGENFCINHATECSNKIRTCYNEVRQQVEQVETRLNQNAATYNASSEAFIARQEQLLQQIKAHVLQDQQMISQFFPGAEFDLAAGLHISMPEMKEIFGVQLRGGGEIDHREISQKLQQMKGELQRQQRGVNDVIANYIGEQQQNMQRNKARWRDLASQCDQFKESYRAQMMDQYRQQMESFSTHSQQLGDFCNRFDRLGFMAPQAACSGVVQDLFEDSMGAISQHLSGDALGLITEYNNFCESDQNEVPTDLEIPNNLVTLCEVSGDNFNEGLEMFIREFAESASDDEIRASDIRNYITEESDAALPRDFIDYYQREITGLREMQRAATSSLDNHGDLEEYAANHCRSAHQDLLDQCEDAQESSDGEGTEPPSCRRAQQRINQCQGQVDRVLAGFHTEDDICQNIRARQEILIVAHGENTNISNAARNFLSVDRAISRTYHTLNDDQIRSIASSSEHNWSRLGESSRNVSCHAGQSGGRMPGDDFLRNFDAQTGDPGSFGVGR